MVQHRGLFQAVGPHLIRVERPDVLFMRLHGDVESEHVEAFFATINAEIPHPTPVYLLRDAHRGGFVAPSARVFISRHPIIRRIAAVVSFGTSLQTKTVMTMLSRGMRAFQDREPDTMFAPDEATARQWIAEHRRFLTESALEFA